MRVAKNIFFQKFLMFLNLRLGIDASAGVIEIHMLGIIQPVVILLAERVY